METLTRLYEYYKWGVAQGDPRTQHWPLVASPIPTAVLCACYLCMVFGGQRIMKHFKPFELRNIMIVYNVGIVLLSAYMCKEFMLGGWATSYTFGCVSCDFRDFEESPEAYHMANAVWWYYISKFIEFFDTLCFVLRKKNDQITFLHVLHHFSMPWWWLGIHFCPGGMGTFHAMLNTIVHVFMYGYYALSAADMRSWLWWKPYLTILQITQFILIMVHTFQLFVTDCPYRHQQAFKHCIVGYAFVFLVLFCNFYVQAYLKRRRFPKSATTKNDTEKTKTDMNGYVHSNGQAHRNGYQRNTGLSNGHATCNGVHSDGDNKTETDKSFTRQRITRSTKL